MIPIFLNSRATELPEITIFSFTLLDEDLDSFVSIFSKELSAG